MKRLLSVFVLLLLAAVPAMAVDIGGEIDVDITPEEFEPLIWGCDSRRLLEDSVEEGRMTDSGSYLVERTQNYAFEGEQILWSVLVMDKNKIEEITDVVATLSSVPGIGGDIEVECSRAGNGGHTNNEIPPSCNARIDEEMLTTFDPDTMEFYDCVLTVETPDSMYDEYWITVEVISEDGEAAMDENEFWFLNPEIALGVDATLTFEDVRPGTVSYSETLTVTNAADDGSGVLLDMFISGTDFYDPDSSGARCPDSNRLKLSDGRRSQASLGAGTNANDWHRNHACQAGTTGLTTDNADHLCYYATNGAYSTAADANADAEGYKPIVYSDVFTRDFYNDAEIMRPDVGYSAGNVLAPGADIAITFKLGLPEPCVGDFSDGSLFFWGEAI